MNGRRRALLVANSDYQDQELGRLRAPAQDAADLADVLGDPAIGGFEVATVLDGTGRDVRIALESLLTSCRPDDFALVYLSCHGLLDARGQLWFTASDTIKALVAGTGIEAAWLSERLENCRAVQQLVLLDCCFSGAYLKGSKGPVEVRVDTLHGGGRGRVVLTASRATEYSYEGEPVNGVEPAGSVFTSALVHGLRTGEADLDHDGMITTDEAYHYVNDYLRGVGAKQTPTQNVVGGVGKIVLARSRATVRPAAPAKETDKLVAEAAEIMAVTPAATAPTAREADAGAAATPTQAKGPAADFATLRAIRQVLDDPEALAAALRERSVADVVKVIAAVRASGLGGRAAEVLRLAATTRPIDEVLALAAAVWDGPHQADADVLFAAYARTRPLDDLLRLCADPEPRWDRPVRSVLQWAARSRPVTEVRDLARSLPAESARQLLREYGRTRTAVDVVELITDAPDPSVSALLDGVERKPVNDFATVVSTLRATGADTVADRLLGVVERIPPDRIVQLCEALRAANAADDAETLLRWAGWQLRPPVVAALMAALDAAALADSLSTVAKAAESRAVDDIYEMARAAVGAHRGHAGPVLDLVPLESPEDLKNLLDRLVSQAPDQRGRHRAWARGVAAVDRLRSADTPILFREEARWEPVVTPLVTAVATARVVTVRRFVRVFVEVGWEQTAQRLITASAARSWAGVAGLVAAVAANASRSVLDVLVKSAADFPPNRLSAALVGFHQAAPQTFTDQFVAAIPPIRWREVPPVPAQFRAAALRLNALQQNLRRQHQAATVRNATVGVALLAMWVVILLFFASLTQLVGNTGFDRGDWAAWMLTMSTSVLLGFWVAEPLLDRIAEMTNPQSAITSARVMATCAVVGFVCGWFVPPLSDAAAHVRDWLAWNF